MSDRARSILALLLTLALALGVVGASGCTATTPSGGPAQKPEGPQKGGSISFEIGDPAYIDPYNAQESEGVQVVHALFASLTAFDPKDPTKLIPAAAEKWQANTDATVWTFTLNKNDKFADGTVVAAKDFVYAWNRVANPKTVNSATKKEDPSAVSYHLAMVKGYQDLQDGKATEMSGLKAVDDFTFEVTLSQPFGDFEYVVAHPALAPVQKTLVEGGVDYKGQKVAFADMPMGNGPFKMAEPWKRGQYIKVVRNDDYFGTKPLLDGVEFRQFKDPNTAYLEFEAGNLDFSQIGEGKIKDASAKYGVSPDGYTANPGKQVLLGAENSTYYLVMNNQTLSNPNLRKAISLGINRQAICDAVFQGTRDPADNIVPPGIAGYEKAIWPDSKYDMTAAKKALADAGFPDGKGAPEIQLWYNADGGHQKIMELVQADLTNLGLKVKINTTPDFPTYLKQLDAGKVMAGRLGWVADYPIMDNFLYPIFQSKSTDNYSKFNDPAVDSALLDARKTPNTADRLKKYQDIDKMVGAKTPIAPIMFYKHHHVASDRVHDFVFDAMYFADFSKTWVTGGAAAKPGSSAASETTSK